MKWRPEVSSRLVASRCKWTVTGSVTDSSRQRRNRTFIYSRLTFNRVRGHEEVAQLAQEEKFFWSSCLSCKNGSREKIYFHESV